MCGNGQKTKMKWSRNRLLSHRAFTFEVLVAKKVEEHSTQKLRYFIASKIVGKGEVNPQIQKFISSEANLNFFFVINVFSVNFCNQKCNEKIGSKMREIYIHLHISIERWSI